MDFSNGCPNYLDINTHTIRDFRCSIRIQRGQNEQKSFQRNCKANQVQIFQPFNNVKLNFIGNFNIHGNN